MRYQGDGERLVRRDFMNVSLVDSAPSHTSNELLGCFGKKKLFDFLLRD